MSTAKTASEIALMRQPGSPIPINHTTDQAIPGQGNSYNIVPAKITHSVGSNGSGPPRAANASFLNADGSVSIWPSNDAKQAIEDSPYEYEHMYRNRIVPYLGDAINRYVIQPWDDFKIWHKRASSYSAGRR